METKFHYESASVAINELKRQGYSVDFNLQANHLVGADNQFSLETFEIKDIYRYEGDSDPADEVIIYAIESQAGIKGMFVAGYGVSSDDLTAGVIARLKKQLPLNSSILSNNLNI